MPTSKRHFESDSTNAVIDTFPPDEEVCELAVTDVDGIGIVTPDGEHTHVEWAVAQDRYIPARTASFPQ